MTRAEQLLTAIGRAEFPHHHSLIHVFVGGSELHGAKVKDTDDLDIYGAYLEPPELALGLEKSDFFEHGGQRPSKWARRHRYLPVLAAQMGWTRSQGQPTALHFLFAPNYAAKSEPWADILSSRQVFLSRQAASQFRGFADAQVRRLKGIGTGKKGQRDELIGDYGYDIKAAMHVIRLLNEGIELMRFGTITLPRPEKDLLVTIRTGKYGSLDRVLELANSLFAELEKAEAQSDLPETVDRLKISQLVSGSYLRFWLSPDGHSI
jgi:hypothetical protein